MRVRTLLATALFLLVRLGLQAQGFSLTAGTAPYTDLNGAVPISGNVIWDEDYWTVSLGFPFTLNGQSYSDLEVGDGRIFLRNSANELQFILPWVDDLHSLGTAAQPDASPISMLVSGTAGNHIAKIEWKNAGLWYSPVPGAEFMNFQVWLYESDKAIEFRYGPHSSTVTNVAAIIGVATEVDTTGQSASNSFRYSAQLISGPFSNPQLITFDDSLISQAAVPVTTVFPYFFSIPPDGTFWRLSYDSASVTAAPAALSALPVSLWPNPFTDRIDLKGFSGPATISVYDALGRRVYFQKSSGESAVLEPDNLPAGPYLMEILSEGRRYTQKLMKE